jgi:hypothetical protein
MDKDNMVQVRISLPEDYKRLFKAHCTKPGTDMSKKITELVRQELIKAGELQNDTSIKY